MAERSPLILAVDTTDIDRVNILVEETQESIGIYKFGLEFYLQHGIERLREIKSAHSIEIFLDLKLHDIPNTVGKAALSIASLDPKFLTVHGAGGSEMIKAAVTALPQVSIAAVTILTSLDQPMLASMGIGEDVSSLVQKIATLSVNSGAKALVASPLEVSLLRRNFPDCILITPGIRLEEGKDDQRRTMSPAEAITAGSDYLVIGRPITEADSPGETAKRILTSLGDR
jgi:orotidine-5'-phosphate decarboxylase